MYQDANLGTPPPLHKKPLESSSSPHVHGGLAEAEVLRREETAALEDRERTEEMTPATIQSSRETLMLTDELDPPGTTTPQEPRTSPPGLLTPTAEPLAAHSPAEPAAARRREVPL